MVRSRLTRKQETFVDEYVSNGENGTQAVLKAYDVANSITAKSMASENLAKPYISEAIEARRCKVREALEMALIRTHALSAVVDAAMLDIKSDDPRVANDARKILLDCARVARMQETKAEGDKHIHLKLPVRK